jgi:hypothetical protein
MSDSEDNNYPLVSETAIRKFQPMSCSLLQSVNLDGMVATVGFPDIGLQGFAPGKVTSDVWRVT